MPVTVREAGMPRPAKRTTDSGVPAGGEVARDAGCDLDGGSSSVDNGEANVRCVLTSGADLSS